MAGSAINWMEDIKIQSDIIVDSCELLPKLYDVVYDRIRLKEEHRYAIHCGSSVEFFIKPLNPCVSDYDTLDYSTDKLVFTSDCPVLPLDVSDLSDTIECFKIEPTRYPGFVRLRAFGKMCYNWRFKRYDFSNTTSPNVCLTMKHGTADAFIRGSFGALSESLHGPAMTLQHISI